MRHASPKLVDAADRIALVVSAACLIHCLALPLLFAALPVFSQALRLPEALHLWMVAVAMPTSTYALLTGGRGYLSPPVPIGFVGLGLLVTGTTAGEGRSEAFFTVAGALILSAAHVLNWRRRHREA